jgi:hypothetical protein
MNAPTLRKMGMGGVRPVHTLWRCWNDRILDVSDELPKTAQAREKALVTKIPYAGTREDADHHERAVRILDHGDVRMTVRYAHLSPA